MNKTTTFEHCEAVGYIRSELSCPGYHEIRVPQGCLKRKGHFGLCSTYPISTATGQVFFTWDRFAAGGKPLASMHRMFEI